MQEILKQHSTRVQTHARPTSLHSLFPVVTLASTLARAEGTELATTLRSLLQQSVPPTEIRLYLPSNEESAFARLQSRGKPGLIRYLNDSRVRLHFVEDVGPSTKFYYIIRDLLDEGAFEQPVVVLDDDHSYSSDLVSTLMYYSEQSTFANTAIGLRGWRVRRDLQWGVSPGEMEDHIAEGWRIREPFQVGVLTANEGYFVRPRFFLDNSILRPEDLRSNSSPSRAQVLHLGELQGTPARYADDIWLSGHLAARGIQRYVVPLRPSQTYSRFTPPGLHDAIPSIDVTKHHTLEDAMEKRGGTRAVANWVAIKMFEKAWRREDLFYVTKRERLARPALLKELELRPRSLNRFHLARRYFLRFMHKYQVKMLFRNSTFAT